MENEINKQRVSRENCLWVRTGKGSRALVPLVNVARLVPFLPVSGILAEQQEGAPWGTAGEIDKRNIEIAAMTNYIGQGQEPGQQQEPGVVGGEGQAGHGACS